MRRAAAIPLLLLLLLSATALAPSRAGATVTSIVGSKSYTPADEVAIFRRNTAEITIHGSLLDLCTGVEIRRAGVKVTDPAVLLVARHGSPDTRIIVDLTGDSNTPLGSCELWIRYAVEANGPDIVKLHVWDRGAPTLTAFPPTGGKAGETMKVTFTGSGLANAQFKIIDIPELNRSFQEVDRTDTKYSFTCNPIFPGSYPGLTSRSLVDRNLPSDLRSLPEAGYDASTGTGIAYIAANPIVSTAPIATANVGQSISISGLNLSGNDPAKFRTLLRYLMYNPDQIDPLPPVTMGVTSATTGSVTLTVPDNFVPGTTQIVVQDLATGIMVGSPTPVFFVTPTHAPTVKEVLKGIPAGFHPPLIGSTPLTAAQAAHIFCSTDSVLVVSTYANVPASQVQVSFAGQALTEVSHEYHATANETRCLPAGGATPLSGKIRISVGGSGLGFTTTTTKGSALAVATSAQTTDDYFYVPPPSGAAFVTVDGTVKRGTSIKVTATNAGPTAAGTMLKPQLRLTDSAATTVTLDAISTDAGSALFLVPANAALGAIRGAIFQHYGGQAVVASQLSVVN